MISRRQFLRGKFSSRQDSPPATAGPPRAFIDQCCLAFANVVCRSCSDACSEAAIRFSPRLGGAALPEVIAERCTACGDCVSACPASAVKLTGAGAA